MNGLRKRGHHVTIFHKGTHEIPEIPVDVEFIHGDPHFRETIEEAIGTRTFDLVVATYGRIRHVAEAMVGRTGRFVAGGGFAPTAASSIPIPVEEDAPIVATAEEQHFS